ncbi:TetR/AcrR family transcriptional regulator [Mesorhizobium denitrificans]|uniref:TetR/AcrR family transcriptional regulator n=3 Tax=Mesorhizobium TaxID=68287 RepID=A0A371XCY2_9HYPH|nr:TetR/AcrR family transcriptional regulator [Mesorhizobium denitrificans]
MSRRERQKADTRAELLSAAHELIAEEGYEGLTIRKLAEKVGYAPMSVYSYFADKDEILLAVAEDAFATLARRVASRQTDNPLESIRRGLNEYAAFAIENPNEYITVFMTPKAHQHEDETFDTLKKNNPCLNLLLSQIDAAVSRGQMKGDVFAIGTMLWATIHGAVSLLITFPKFPFGEPAVFADRMIDAGMRSVIDCEIAPLGDPGECGTNFKLQSSFQKKLYTYIF